MADVAAAAGVAPITVSRAISTPLKVSNETRERVMKAVTDLGYVMDEGAGALSSRRTRSIGALVSTLSGPAFATTIDGLSTALRKRGYHLILASTDYSEVQEEEYIAAMLARRPAGLVLSATDHTENAKRLLSNSGIPVVEIWELPEKSEYHAVGYSNELASYKMVRALLESGRRKIGLLGNTFGSDQRVTQRVNGYKRALESYGIGEHRIVSLNIPRLNGVERGALEFSKLIEQWPDSDAAFCVNDTIALGAVCEANRKGIDIPEQIGVAGFGDTSYINEHGMNITTIHFAGEKIGRCAAELIVSELKIPSPKPTIIDVGFEIMWRGTT